jgi:ribosomal protein L7Ae-like RNA K-turn-binding protein
MLGLAEKAGKVQSGAFLAEKAIKGGIAEMVLIASDTSYNTRKQFINSCKWYNIKCYEFIDKETLGKAIGKEERAVIAITDKGLAKAIKEKMEQQVLREARLDVES